MARRHAHRRIGKDVLALAVRKDFNAAIVFESELITSFLYAAQNQGKHRKRFREYGHLDVQVATEKNFRMRFEPSQAKQGFL